MTTRVAVVGATGRLGSQVCQVIEGLQAFDVIARLNSAPGLTGEVTAIPAEGTLLPDTYSYALNEDRQVVLDRMVAAMSDALAAMVDEAPCVCSIVQGACGYFVVLWLWAPARGTVMEAVTSYIFRVFGFILLTPSQTAALHLRILPGNRGRPRRAKQVRWLRTTEAIRDGV